MADMCFTIGLIPLNVSERIWILSTFLISLLHKHAHERALGVSISRGSSEYDCMRRTCSA